MLSQTRRALEDFDNSHEFERLAADVLNALGYSGVEPMAPRGGSDGGRDIRFREGDAPGIALVTLEKRIKDKFNRDLQKQESAEGVLALFCNVDVTPGLKLEFAREAIAKGFRLEVFDIERLRSLLDIRLTDIRRRYLGIDDEVAARLRSAVTKLLRFPDAVPDTAQPPTILESLFINKLPRRVFDILLTYEERDIREVPEIGQVLQRHLVDYYAFRRQALASEEQQLAKIGRAVSVRLGKAWRIYLRYAVMRFGGISQQQIIEGGNFLNYSISWEDAERVFQLLRADPEVAVQVSGLLLAHQGFCETLNGIIPQRGSLTSL
jgi:hypothetical protein